ncbi:unnamed protein product, partial [Amoebophrya sp. A120]
PTFKFSQKQLLQTDPRLSESFTVWDDKEFIDEVTKNKTKLQNFLVDFAVFKYYMLDKVLDDDAPLRVMLETVEIEDDRSASFSAMVDSIAQAVAGGNAQSCLSDYTAAAGKRVTPTTIATATTKTAKSKNKWSEKQGVKSEAIDLNSPPLERRAAKLTNF